MIAGDKTPWNVKKINRSISTLVSNCCCQPLLETLSAAFVEPAHAGDLVELTAPFLLPSSIIKLPIPADKKAKGSLCASKP